MSRSRVSLGGNLGGAILVALLLLLALVGFRLRPDLPPDHASVYVTIGDPGNPPETSPIARGSKPSGLCADGKTFCQTDARCRKAGAPEPCTTFSFPESFEERGAVPYVFEIRVLPVQVPEYLECVADGACRFDARALQATGEGTATPTPQLVEPDVEGGYRAVAPTFPWPYASPEDAMRFANWRDPDRDAYRCWERSCSPERIEGARIVLASWHESTKAAGWHPETRSWWTYPGNGGAAPVPGVDANVGGSIGVEPWPANCIGSAGFARHPTALCRLVPVGGFPHYRSPWGVQDLCSNGMEPTDTPGELWGEVSPRQVILMGTIPLLTSQDCQPDHLKQGFVRGTYWHSKIRLVRLSGG